MIYFLHHIPIHSFIQLPTNESVCPCWAARMLVDPSWGSRAHLDANALRSGVLKSEHRAGPLWSGVVDETQFKLFPWVQATTGRCSVKRHGLWQVVSACGCHHAKGRHRSWTEQSGSGLPLGRVRCAWLRLICGVLSRSPSNDCGHRTLVEKHNCVPMSLRGHTDGASEGIVRAASKPTGWRI